MTCDLTPCERRQIAAEEVGRVAMALFHRVADFALGPIQPSSADNAVDSIRTQGDSRDVEEWLDFPAMHSAIRNAFAEIGKPNKPSERTLRKWVVDRPNEFDGRTRNDWIDSDDLFGGQQPPERGHAKTHWFRRSQIAQIESRIRSREFFLRDDD